MPPFSYHAEHCIANCFFECLREVRVRNLLYIHHIINATHPTIYFNEYIYIVHICVCAYMHTLREPTDTLRIVFLLHLIFSPKFLVRQKRPREFATCKKEKSAKEPKAHTSWTLCIIAELMYKWHLGGKIETLHSQHLCTHDRNIGELVIHQATRQATLSSTLQVSRAITDNVATKTHDRRRTLC